MKGRSLLGRRALLRGLGGVAIGLPFLEVMAPPARAAAFPKRFVVFFSANGTIDYNWDPAGTATDFTLGPILAPLAPFKDKLILMRGFNNQACHTSPGDGHQNGMGCMLTGTELNEGDLFCLGDCSEGKYVGWGGGISIDQFVAQEVGSETKFPSVEFGVKVEGSDIWARMSYLGSDQPVPPEDNPAKNFDRLFSELGADPFGLEELKAKRKSVLDVVGADYEALKARLGAADFKKVDAHLTAVRDIEKGLSKPGGVLGGACQIPAYDNPGDVYANDNYPLVGKAQMDLMVMALACDLTRVVSIQWDSSVSNIQFNWLGIPQGHHDLSHEGDENSDAQNKLTQINTWYAEQLAYFLGKLAAIQEGEGTLLDNTVVLWCNELAKGNSHSPDDMRWLLAGSCGGYFKTGRSLSYAGDPHNNLLVSIAQAMGIAVNTFGNPAHCTGPMAKLTG